MSNVQSYNALIDRFKAFASGHFILKRFSHGQIEVSDLEKFGEYPFMHVVPSNVTYSKGMKTFSFQIVLADMPRDKEEKPEYQREVLSDLQRIAEDLIAEITNHRVLFGDLITVQNVSLEPFLEEFQHTLTGWTISLDLLVPYYWDACSIPAEWNDFFESSTGGTGSILTFIDSINRDENGNVSLINDEETPSPNYYYGTNDEGVRGWYLLEAGGGLTCETIGDCQTIIDIEAAIDALEEEILLKADITSISAVGFSNDYNDLDNKPTIPNAQVNSDWNATSGVAEILNKPTIPTATSDLTNDGEDGVNPFITAQDLPSLTGYVPYTGATQNVDLGTHTLSAKDLVINHSSGSGVAASITKGGAGEALTVNKTSGSGNAMSVTGGVTQLSELHLTTDLADAYIASAATWNAKFNLPALTSGSVLFSNGTTIAQDNANLFWDDTNNRLGVGTNAPFQRLSVVGTTTTTPNNATWISTGNPIGSFYGEGDAGNMDFFIGGASTTISSRPVLIGRKSAGTLASPTALSNGHTIFSFLSSGFSGTTFINTASINMIVDGSVSSTSVPQAITFETGASSRAERMRLSSSGNLLINTTTDSGFKLDVNGTTMLRGIVYGVGSGGGAIQLLTTAGTGTAVIGGSSGTPMRIQGQNIQILAGSTQVGQFFDTTGNLRLQNGGTFTDSGYRLDVQGTSRFSGSAIFGSSMTIGGAVAASSSLAVGTNSTAVASAQMEIVSTTRGFLPPRMTSAQRTAIASPATGLIVYQTDGVEGLYVKKAAAWAMISLI